MTISIGTNRNDGHTTGSITPPLPRVPSIDRTGLDSHGHAVQFYGDDAFPIDDLARYIGSALGAGDAGVVIATKAHRDKLSRRLKALGLDIALAIRQGRYVSLDADETLSRFMRDGWPDAARFAELMGGVIERAAAASQGKGRRVAAFGEMVALLCAEGKPEAAIRLEQLWNDLAMTRSFELHCAYPMSLFPHADDAEAVGEICATHSRVIPAESYTSLSNDGERFRAIAILQQKAHALEAQIEEHKKVQQALERREIALRAGEARFRTMADTVPVMVWVSDTGKRRTYFNRCWFEFTGRALEQELGYGWTEDLHPDDLRRYLELYESSFDAREEFKIEYRLRRFDGAYRWVLSHGVPFFSPDGTFAGYIGCSMDITERVELEERKDAFIALASHELKTPITSLKIFAQMMKRRLERAGEGESDMAKHFARMDAQLNKLTGLVLSLLDVSKIQAGKLDYNMERVVVDDLVVEVVDELRTISGGHAIEVIGQAKVEIDADRDRIRQVLTNLVTNAIKFSPKADRVVVRSRYDARRKQVTISVRDFGIGIPRNEQDKVFDRFFQANHLNSTSSESDESAPRAGTYPGLGLGLYICSEIVARHGGRIWVESQVGHGSTFYFTLPVAASSGG